MRQVFYVTALVGVVFLHSVASVPLPGGLGGEADTPQYSPQPSTDYTPPEQSISSQDANPQDYSPRAPFMAENHPEQDQVVYSAPAPDIPYQGPTEPVADLSPATYSVPDKVDYTAPSTTTTTLDDISYQAPEKVVDSTYSASAADTQSQDYKARDTDESIVDATSPYYKAPEQVIYAATKDDVPYQAPVEAVKEDQTSTYSDPSTENQSNKDQQVYNARNNLDAPPSPQYQAQDQVNEAATIYTAPSDQVVYAAPEVKADDVPYQAPDSEKVADSTYSASAADIQTQSQDYKARDIDVDYKAPEKVVYAAPEVTKDEEVPYQAPVEAVKEDSYPQASTYSAPSTDKDQVYNNARGNDGNNNGNNNGGNDNRGNDNRGNDNRGNDNRGNSGNDGNDKSHGSSGNSDEVSTNLERAASHSVHPSFQKELPYEFAQPSKPVEVEEVYDPYSNDADDPFAETTPPPTSTYTSEEQGYNNPDLYPEEAEVEDPAVINNDPTQEEEEVPYDQETPYQEEQGSDADADAYATPETYQEEQGSDTDFVDDDTPSQLPYEDETPYQEGSDFVDDTDATPTETPYEQEAPYEETPYQEGPASNVDDAYDTPTETPYQEEEPEPTDPYQEEETTDQEEEKYSPPVPEEEEEYSPTESPPSYYPEEEEEDQIEGAGSSPGETYQSSNYQSYTSAEEETYDTTTTTTTTEPPISSFLQAFDRILQASDAYRTSLTPILLRLVEDASGRKGVVICKLGRTRIIVTKAVKALLESYSHWVKLGTTIEESHCRFDSKLALLAFSTEMNKVAQDLSKMEELDMDLEVSLEAPTAAFKRLERVIARTVVLFEEEVQNIYVNEYGKEEEEYGRAHEHGNVGHGH